MNQYTSAPSKYPLITIAKNLSSFDRVITFKHSQFTAELTGQFNAILSLSA